MHRAHPASLGTKRDSSSCRDPSLPEVIFQQEAQETTVTSQPIVQNGPEVPSAQPEP